MACRRARRLIGRQMKGATMKRRWFKEWGWLYYPVAWQGVAFVVLTMAFCLNVFVVVDRHSHSVRDTLSGIFALVESSLFESRRRDLTAGRLATLAAPGRYQRAWGGAGCASMPRPSATRRRVTSSVPGGQRPCRSGDASTRPMTRGSWRSA